MITVAAARKYMVTFTACVDQWHFTSVKQKNDPHHPHPEKLAF